MAASWIKSKFGHKKDKVLPPVKSKPNVPVFGSKEKDLSSDEKSEVKPSAEKREEKNPSLFDDEETDVFVSTATKPSIDSGKKKPVGGVSLFGGVDILKKNVPAEGPVEKSEEKVKDKSVSNKDKTKLSLFDEDEDEEDLFGTSLGSAKSKTEEKKNKDTSEVKKTGSKSLFTTTKDDAALFASVEESPSVDVFNKKPANKPSVTKKSEPVAKKPAKTPTAPLGLFDDDDDSDLFGSTKREEKLTVSGVTETESTDTVEKKAPPKEEKPQVVKPKKMAGAVSMFGGMDPSALLRKKKSVESPERGSEEKEEDIKDISPEEKKGIKIEKKKSDLLFGSDDDDGDILVSKKSQVPKPVPPKTLPKTLPKPALKSALKSTGSTPSSPEPTASPSSPSPLSGPKQWKPAGAVSMFAGMDPLAGLKKKQAASFEKPSPTDEKISPVEEKTTPRLNDTADDSKTDSVSTPSENGIPAAPALDNDLLSDLPDIPKSSRGPRPIRSSAGKIGSLQANLTINPSALLPGAAPPSITPEPSAASFDEPAETSTLASANKERAKISRKRRPQSRYARRSQVFEAGVNYEDFASMGSPTDSPTDNLLTNGLPNGDEGSVVSRTSPEKSRTTPEKSLPLPDTPLSTQEKSSTPPKADLFGNDDLLEDLKSDTPVLKANDDKDTKDVFSSGKFSSGASNSNASEKQTNEDLFSNLTKTNKEEKSEKDTDKDTLFSPRASENKSEKSNLSKEKNKSLRVTDDDDDLFASSAIKNSSRKDRSDKWKSKDSTVAADDDIFADASVNKKKSETKSKIGAKDKEEAPVTGILKKKTKIKDEDDDIFAESLSSKDEKAKKRRPKKAATKDETLFKDDTDIFADIPASKPKESRKKKKVATEKKAIFKDDINDIFADSTPVVGKSKKDSGKKKEEIKASTTDDIFDDPLGTK